MIRFAILILILVFDLHANDDRLRVVLEQARAKRLGRVSPSPIGVVDLALLYRLHPENRSFVTALSGFYQGAFFGGHEHDLYQNWESLYRGRDINEKLEGSLSELSALGSRVVLSPEQTRIRQNQILADFVSEIHSLRRSKNLYAVLNHSQKNKNPVIGATNLNCELLKRIYEKHKLEALAQEVCLVFFTDKEKP